MKSYRDLEIYSLSYDLAIKVHHASLKLPKFELFEEGSQVSVDTEENTVGSRHQEKE